MFDELIDIYDSENFLRELDYKRKQIIAVFEQIFQDEAENFDLLYQNPIQNGRYYKIESRIKKTDSLREKFFRRNIGLELIRNLDLTPENINYKAVRKKVRQAYCLLDDIIGIRIVTELKADCRSALSLIENRISLFNQGGIFFQTDFDSQPTIMDNGLEIIKLKGIFEGKNAFELQIKSKIDSAWGDIDHKLFYKDYNRSSVKDGLQVSMNNIGELLNQIEKFLFDLRETNSGIGDQEYDQHLIDYLFEVLSPSIDAKLNINYDFKRILNQVVFFCKDLGVVLPAGDLDFSYFEKISDFGEFPAYEMIRKYNFDYVLSEVVFVNLLLEADSDVILDDSSGGVVYSDVLKHYFVVLAKYMEKRLRETEAALEKAYYKTIYKKMMMLMTYTQNPDVLLDFERYRKIRLIDKIIIDVIVEHELTVDAKDISDLFTLYAFKMGEGLSEFRYDDEEDYIDVLTKVKRQVEAMDNPPLLAFFNPVILKIAKDIESKEGE